MKKILVFSLALIIFNQGTMWSNLYVHVANLTNEKVKVKIIYNWFVFGDTSKSRNRAVVDPSEAEIEPGDVKFFELGEEYHIEYHKKPSLIIIEKLLKSGFTKIDDNRVMNPENKVVNMKTQATLTPSNTDYYAFVIKPLDEANFVEIKQRTNADAKLILEEHKNPTNPMFIQDLPTGQAAVDLLLKGKIGK